MTEQTTAISLEAIDAALGAAVPGLGDDEQRLAVAVLRLLAAGQPVAVPAAAGSAGLPGPRAEQALRSWPAVFRDDHGQVTGFAGLALAAMPHRLRHAGTDLFFGHSCRELLQGERQDLARCTAGNPAAADGEQECF